MARSFFDMNLLKQMMPKQGMPQGMLGAPTFDMSVLLETQRKNAQAMSEIMQLSMESLQQAATRQSQLMNRMVEDNSQIASSLMVDGTPEQKMQHQAELLRTSYETSVKNAQELGDMIAKSNEEAGAIINRRVSASLNEFKAAFEADSASAPATKTAANNSGKAKAKTTKAA